MRRSGFDHGPVHVVIAMDMVLRQGLLSVLLFYSVTIIPPVRYTILTRRTSGRSMGTFRQSNDLLHTGGTLERKLDIVFLAFEVLN